MSRRGFLTGSLATMTVGALAACKAPDRPPPQKPNSSPDTPRVPVRSGRWSDPATWNGRVPGRNDHVVVEKPVLLDTNARVAGLEILAPGALRFEPGASRRLESSGNVVVRGRLSLRPDNADVVHRLVFVDVDERDYVGGGMDPRPSDVGLWVVDAGLLDARGAPKRAWTRAAGSIPAGARTVQLAASPTGWAAGDEIILTPTRQPAISDYEAFFTSYDVRTISGISGNVIQLSQPTQFAHPAVTVAPGKTFAAEVLNVTRNVRIEGTPGHRAHVFVHSDEPQTVSHTSLRYLGPRQHDGVGTVSVLGRYMLHFHHCMNASRGSVVEGVVARDGGAHAFVPHMSHGITMRDCISHNTSDEAYWWDLGDHTHDVTWERCVASSVHYDPEHRGHRLAGFLLGRGEHGVMRDCVAVGVNGGSSASGFTWPEGESGVWTFQDNLAHNNRVFGIFTWQNTDVVHAIERYVAYHCGAAGISHGAYVNPYQYRNSTLYANGGIDSGEGATGLVLHAKAKELWSTIPRDQHMRFADLLVDAAGIADYGVVTVQHNNSSTDPTPVRFERIDFKGARKAAFRVTKSSNPGLHELVDCTFDGNAFWFENDIHPNTLVRFVNGGQTWELRRRDQAGELWPEWNAAVTIV